jgi:hypothetical protein
MPARALLRAAPVAFAIAASAAHAGEAAPAPEREEQARPRDAAEAVQEGNVTQWLEHYQRERGGDWARQKADAEERPPSPAPAAPAKK